MEAHRRRIFPPNVDALLHNGPTPALTSTGEQVDNLDNISIDKSEDRSEIIDSEFEECRGEIGIPGTAICKFFLNLSFFIICIFLGISGEDGYDGVPGPDGAPGAPAINDYVEDEEGCQVCPPGPRGFVGKEGPRGDQVRLILV